MRLIDADALRFTMLYKENWLKGTGGEAPAVWKQDIDDAPTIDAVPVVRCRVCAHCDGTTPYELWCLGRGWPNQMVPPDGYCDKGKRREAAT